MHSCIYLCMCAYMSHSFVGRETTSGRFSLAANQSTADVAARLGERKRCKVEEFVQALDLRAAKYGKVSI